MPSLGDAHVHSHSPALPALLLAIGLGWPVHADPPTTVEPPRAEPPTAEGEKPASPGDAAAKPDVKVEEIRPKPSLDAFRLPVEGLWQPTLLPPNDLTDPPVRYPNAEGGTCVGMSAVVHGLWAARISRDEIMTVDKAADVFIRNMLLFGDDRGQRVMPNERIPELIVLGGRIRNVKETETLVRIAEIIQNRLQPGGGKEKTAEQIRQSHAEVQEYENRITGIADLRRRIALAGGRLVVGAVHFDEALTETSGHAFVLTLDARGDVFVWDPNSRMAGDALGSGRLAPLKYDLVDANRFTAVRYEIELPDGTKQARRFEYLFPIRTFVPRNKVPPSPRERSQP